jgi:hypothetical protein
VYEDKDVDDIRVVAKSAPFYAGKLYSLVVGLAFASTELLGPGRRASTTLRNGAFRHVSAYGSFGWNIVGIGRGYWDSLLS